MLALQGALLWHASVHVASQCSDRCSRSTEPDHRTLELAQRFENATWIFYNRIPKAGSTSLLYVAEAQRESGRLRVFHSRNYLNFAPTKPELGCQLFHGIFNRMEKGDTVPVLYDRHTRFIDFQKLALKPPVYVNVLREPVGRLISWCVPVAVLSPQVLLPQAGPSDGCCHGGRACSPRAPVQSHA
jgi:hypothetical protein